MKNKLQAQFDCATIVLIFIALVGGGVALNTLLSDARTSQDAQRVIITLLLLAAIIVLLWLASKIKVNNGR